MQSGLGLSLLPTCSCLRRAQGLPQALPQLLFHMHPPNPLGGLAGVWGLMLHCCPLLSSALACMATLPWVGPTTVDGHIGQGGKSSLCWTPGGYGETGGPHMTAWATLSHHCPVA